jgi:hypothetical protein
VNRPRGPDQPPLPLPHDLRLEGPVPVPGQLDLDLAGALGQHRLGLGPVPHIAGPGSRSAVLLVSHVFGHLLVQRGLQDRLGQPLQQPVRAVRDKPCSRARRTISSAANCSADGSGFFLVTSSSIALITGPLPPNTRLSDQGPETPLNPQTPGYGLLVR